MQFTSSAELFQGIGQRFHLLKWLSQRANFKGTERSQLGEFSWQLGEPLWHLLSGVGRDKFERAVFDQHYAEILLLIISVTGGESEALHEWIYISPYSCAVKDIS